jgi:hypothetical protein
MSLSAESGRGDSRDIPYQPVGIVCLRIGAQLASVFAKEIGGDGYAPEASRAVRLARSLMVSKDVTAREQSEYSDWVGTRMFPASGDWSGSPTRFRGDETL